MTKPKGAILPWILGPAMLAITAALAWTMQPASLELGKDIVRDFPTLLGYFILISLFLERAIEVFLSAIRGSGADALDMDIKNVRERLARAISPKAAWGSSGDPEALQGELARLEKRRMEYSAVSRSVSQWMGLGMGIMIAMVGVRVLRNVVRPDSLGALTQAHIGSFNLVDILLTGAVLAGGAEAFNKIMKVYGNFMTWTADQAKNKKTNGSP